MKAAILFILGFAMIGCADTLETGYIPRKLNSNDSVRRSYYASPFSPESHPDQSSDGVNPAANRNRAYR